MTFAAYLLTTVLSAALLSVPALAQTSNLSDQEVSQTELSNVSRNNINQGLMVKARSQHMVEAIGVIKKVYFNDGVVSLAHDAIPAIKWPGMTMNFPVGKDVNLEALKEGQSVQFTLHRSEDGSFPLVELCPTESVSVIEGLCAPTIDYNSEGGHPNAANHSISSHGPMNQ